MFKLGSNSIGFEVTHRAFGKQDCGMSPKGANDQTSFVTALALLGHPKNFLCYEIFFAHEIIFKGDLIFTLTGAHYQEILLNETPLEHATVYQAQKDDVLRLKGLKKGFRIYLMATSLNPERLHIQCKGYRHYFPQSPDKIRVTQGPEFDYLQEDFFAHSYPIGHQSDLSGLRLNRTLKATHYDIITAGVTDGTIQLTVQGPIILMRHRQSTGGYPRIFNVIEADMDRLAQYPHGSRLSFELITIKESIKLLKVYEKSLKQIQADLL